MPDHRAALGQGSEPRDGVAPGRFAWRARLGSIPIWLIRTSEILLAGCYDPRRLLSGI
ncbi:hypothetical protein LRC484719_03110 [Mycobacterium riyadhense]